MTTDWTGLSRRATSPFELYSINDAHKFEFQEMAITYQATKQDILRVFLVDHRSQKAGPLATGNQYSKHVISMPISISRDSMFIR